MLFNLHTLSWDEKLVEVFGLTGIHLPELKSSSAHFADTDLGGLLNNPIPVTAMVGDSHAAAFGETCFEKGNAKATLGTGCSILMNTGAQLVDSDNGMVTTICWSIPGRVDYALEGVIVSCGATIDWLKNELSLFSDSKETAAMAASIPHNGGVYLVPAFSGLGSPHWNMERRASITGLNFGAGKNHIVRAALESIPYQVKDVIDAMQRDAGIELNGLMLDGGISANEFVIQFLADLLDKKITLIGMPDVSALGAACLAGLYMGIYPSLEVLKTINAGKQFVEPAGLERMKENYEGWCEAVGSKK
jgi:glycerol kinase